MTIAVEIRKRLSPAFAIDVSFTAGAGITILFGASGSGKTTVLRSVAGLTRPDAGRIALGEWVVFDAASGIDVPVQARRIGYVFQQLALFPHLSIEENIGYGLHGLSRAVRRERVRDIAESFAITSLLDRSPDRVSGGERQRAALARALVGNPSILLLDEPLSALDRRIRTRIMDDLRRWNERHGLPVLYVTHSHEEAFALGEHMVTLDAGAVVASGSPHELLDRPGRAPLASLAGFENTFDATIVANDVRGGTMQCRLDGSSTYLEVPIADAEVGTSVRIAIRAGDILVANDEPRGLSARNVLPATLIAVTTRGAAVEALFQAGPSFIVHLTPSSLRSLELRQGDRAWLIVKSYSCRVLAR